jgi:hypothetical protein
LSDEALEVDEFTITRIWKAFVEGGLERPPHPEEQTLRTAAAVGGASEAHIVALARSPARESRSRWGLRLLVIRTVELGHVETLSDGTVRRVLRMVRSRRT